MPPNNKNQKRSGQKRGRDEEDGYNGHNEIGESDEGEKQNAKRKKSDDVKKDDSREEISDSSNSESTKKTPPPRSSKTPNAKGPETPSLAPGKAVKHSESTPDSTPTKPAVAPGGKSAVKCLSDFIEKECEKSLGRLNMVLSESKKHSIDELAKSGATLSEHAENIQKLGKRLLSITEDRLNKFKKRKMTRSSQLISDE